MNTMRIFAIRFAALICFLLFNTQLVQSQTAITPATALEHYLNRVDSTYRWELKDTYLIDDVTVYSILLTSQKWREHIWTHQLSIVVPKETKYDGALLFITGGSVNKEGQPNWSGRNDELTKSFCVIAKQNKAVIAVLKQVPNQPLYGNLTEDALISYTLHQYKNDGDYTWPLLFPMVKSAKLAMDAVQEFSKEKLNHNISRFVVSGASKRGWTTWLTGANDQRVTAIAPMVIDMLNMPVSIDYQVKVWNDYSIQIQDYVKLGIVQDINSKKGSDLVTMIDPYAYRKKLSIPKMIFMGTNDEYWPIDNIKNYYDSIPGQNMIHYIPNAGHSMGDKKEAMLNLSAFFGLTMSNTAYPVCNWKMSESKKGLGLEIQATKANLVDVIIWSANSPDKDFRNDKWVSKSLGIKHKGRVKLTEEFPASGYHAFYVNLKYQYDNGAAYTESTRVFMTDDKKVL